MKKRTSSSPSSAEPRPLLADLWLCSDSSEWARRPPAAGLV